MAAVLPVEYECSCGNKHVEFVTAESGSVYRVPNLRCAVCGSAPVMAYSTKTITTLDALRAAQIKVDGQRDTLVQAELEKDRL
jgi:hypothetical protein